MHVVIRPVALLTVKRLAGVAEVDLRECVCNTFVSAKVNKAELTLALKPKGYVTRNPKQRYQLPQNRTRVYVLQKH